MTLASIHAMRSHYQEAINVYKRLLLENSNFSALNVYLALCYYKLDFYDVSQDALSLYMQAHGDSATAINLRACNYFRLYNSRNAEAELLSLMDRASTSFDYAQDLIKHNLVVFRDGEGAMQHLPGLIDVIPEARLNLVIHFMRNNDLTEAYKLVQELIPGSPQEYILKAVVEAALGQETNMDEHIRIAQEYFQLVGGSASERDTIPGRQCMGSFFFLQKQFADVLIYFNSIKTYFYGDDTFNYNFGQALAANSQWREAEEAFLLVQSEKFRTDIVYIRWLAKTYIMNKKPRLAWELFLRMETSGEAYSLLQLIGNECYRTGQFFYAAKAFDVLERFDPNPAFFDGKRGACVGVFQQVIAKQEPTESLQEVVNLLSGTDNPQAEAIVVIIRRWARENRVHLA
eukprot:m.42540 g.42540  ORF g.42540 m.42540 type:complete len:402 (-) comp12111_c0_seq1:529-1734(-)